MAAKTRPLAKPVFWRRRYDEADAQRLQTKVDPAVCETEMRNRVRQLVARNHCVERAPWWIEGESAQTLMGRTRCQQIRITDRAPTQPGERHPAILLQNLPTLADGALLTFVVSIGFNDVLVGYSIGVRGFTKGMDSRRWYARIDLHETPAGSPPALVGHGYCGHALFHCQFGADPNDADERPTARAPLDFLLPWHALDWILTTIEPDLEPEPFSLPV